MKRASDYVAQYQQEGATSQALVKIWMEMLEEVKELMTKRKARSHDAFASILNEINQKWCSFANKVGINPDGFVMLLKKKFPEAFDGWMKVRSLRNLPILD